MRARLTHPKRSLLRTMHSPGIYARVITTEGEFVVSLFDRRRPRPSANFVGLAEGTTEWTDPGTREKKKTTFYDGLIFHRVIDGFMIQGGVPARQRQGRARLPVRGRVPPALRHSRDGMLSMANAGPNTNGSQFFVTLGPDAAPRQPAHRVRRGRRGHGRRAPHRQGEDGRPGPARDRRRDEEREDRKSGVRRAHGSRLRQGIAGDSKNGQTAGVVNALS